MKIKLEKVVLVLYVVFLFTEHSEFGHNKKAKWPQAGLKQVNGAPKGPGSCRAAWKMPYIVTLVHVLFKGKVNSTYKYA